MTLVEEKYPGTAKFPWYRSLFTIGTAPGRAYGSFQEKGKTVYCDTKLESKVNRELTSPSPRSVKNQDSNRSWEHLHNI
jgi:hypothetical protein